MIAILTLIPVRTFSSEKNTIHRAVLKKTYFYSVLLIVMSFFEASCYNCNKRPANDIKWFVVRSMEYLGDCENGFKSNTGKYGTLEDIGSTCGFTRLSLLMKPSLHAAEGSSVHHSIIPLFQSSIIPIFHYSNLPLFQSSIIPIFQSPPSAPPKMPQTPAHTSTGALPVPP